MKNDDKWENILVPTFLILYASLALWGAVNDGVTADELAHLPAGYSYLVTGDFRMNYEHPPLVKLFAGTPLLFLDMNDEAMSEGSAAWRQGNDGEWVFGNDIVFNSPAHHDTILLWGRIPVILLGLLLGFLIFIFTKQLLGVRPALLSLGLYSVLPEALAHGHLVTTDMGVALGILAAVYFWYNYVQFNRMRDFILTGVCTGLAMSAKFTGVYLYAILGILFVAWRMQEKKQNALSAFVNSILPMVKIVLISLGVLIITYKVNQFHYFFKGLAFVSEHSTYGHQSFLLGMRSIEGWWYYFLLAFFVKTPLAILAGIGLSKFLVFKDKKHPLRTLGYVLAIPVVLYVFAFMVNAINIGVRHIFPIYPFLLIGVGALMLPGKKGKVTLWNKVGIGLLGVQIILTLFFAPHFLSYFNLAAGGPQNGHNILLDSNIDWGQDLKGLEKYVAKQPLEPLYLAYFGNDNSSERNIDFEHAPCYAKKGFFAVSVNQLQGIRQKSSRCFQWLREEHVPFEKIGYSIYLYEVHEELDESEQRLQFCATECEARCVDAGLEYKESSWDQKCKCSCLGPRGP